jgi:hypothetical protein
MILSYDSVRDATYTTGTGTVTLAGLSNFLGCCRSFGTAGVPSGARVKYSIYSVDNFNRPTGDFEVGFGTYNSTGPTLSRDTVLASSNSGSLVSLISGTHVVEIVSDSSEFNALSSYLFGDGGDGNVTISSGTTTLTRNMYYQNLTISGTGQINVNGFMIYVSDMLDITNAPANAITSIPINGNAGVPAGTGGAATTYPTAPATLGWGSPGGAGASGTINGGVAAGNVSAGYCNNGGWMSGTGGTGGHGSAGTTYNGGAGGALTGFFTTDFASKHKDSLTLGVNLILGGVGGGGGGSAGANPSVKGGAGGGGGAGGNVLAIIARIINRGPSTAAGAISAKGGTGGAGAQPTGTGNVGGGGGGAGGAGGWIYLAFQILQGSTATNCLDTSGGTGGVGGNAAATGSTGPNTGGFGGQGGGGGAMTLVNMGASTVATYQGNTAGSTGGSPGSGNNGAGGTAGAAYTYQLNL